MMLSRQQQVEGSVVERGHHPFKLGGRHAAVRAIANLISGTHTVGGVYRHHHHACLLLATATCFFLPLPYL